MTKAWWLALLCGMACACGLAQDNNYWNMQFGAKSSLLGGAVVGTYADNGAMYYNPGALNFKDSTNISVSANLYKIERMRIQNALGKGINLTSYNFDVTPQLISGTRRINKMIELGVIFLTHNDVDVTFQQSHVGNYAIYPEDTTLRYDYIGDFDYRNRINEQWFGFCVGFNINPKFSIGFTHFVTYRFQRFSQHISATAINADTVSGYTAQYDYNRDVRYDVLNSLAKVGILYKPTPKLNLGITLTMPSVNLFGRGKTYTKISASNLALTDYENYTVFERQRGLNAYYNTPFSVALGFEAKFKKLSLYGSTEYFAPLEAYDVINPKDSLNVSKSGVEYNSANLLGVRHSAQQVMNVALGLEWKAFKRVSILASARTDFNTQKDKVLATDNSSLVTSYMSLYHGTLGVNFKRGKKSYLIGFSYAYGRQRGQRQFANFNAPSDGTFLLGPTENTAHYYYKSIGLIFGLTL